MRPAQRLPMRTMTPKNLPTLQNIFRNALLLLPTTQETLQAARQSKGASLQGSLETLQRLQALLATPPIGRGMSWWLKTVAA